MVFNRKKLNNEKLIEIYRNLIFPRLVEEKMLKLLRQGKISKWFSGIGQEAISVGSTLALQSDEYIFPLIRNLGVFTTRGISLKKLFAQFQGKEDGFTKGRDRSFHFGAKDIQIVGLISHLGPQLALADGVALWNKIHNEKKVTVAFSGDGGTSEGDFHEALNVAAVWSLPVIFIVENNGYGLSTPTNEQFKCKNIADKGIGYGIEAITIDGNNVLEVFHTVSNYAEKIRKNPKPVLIEAVTFRMRGHEEASGTKYVPKELFEDWSKKDPVLNYENFLKRNKIIDENFILEVRKEINKRIEMAWEESEVLPPIVPISIKELNDIYAPFQSPIEIKNTSDDIPEKRFIDAISDALFTAMKKNPDLIIMGQDVAEYGGVFKVTDGFVNTFGKERVRNTPLCESAIVGAGLGYAIKGGKAIIEMQFSDFVTCAFNQIVNNLAKIHYRWGQTADVVVRLPSGAGVGAGPFHSQTNEAWFFHTPGLKIAYPSNPYDAKGLLLTAIEDPNPIIFIEHKALYRSLSGSVPNEEYYIPFGSASLLLKGNEVTIVTYGMGVIWAKEVLKKHSYISADLIDLRTLVPWDKNCVAESVKKTGKVIILHEDILTGSVGGEIAAFIAEHYFEFLDAPIVRCASLDTPVPFNTELEKEYLASSRFEGELLKLINY